MSGRTGSVFRVVAALQPRSHYTCARVPSTRALQDCSYVLEPCAPPTQRGVRGWLPWHGCSVPHGPLFATRASLFGRHSDVRRPLRPMEVADMLGTTTTTSAGTNPLDVNLFEDPNGGLSAGPAEELMTTEVAAQVQLLAAGYVPGIFYLLYTPLVDVVQLLVDHELLPDSDERRRAGQTVSSEPRGATAPLPAPALAASGVYPRRTEQIIARWFADGAAVLKNPADTTVHAMGEPRWLALCGALKEFYRPIEPVMPLTRAVRKYRLPERLYLPFLRQLAMALVERESRKTTVAVLPGLTLGLANGRAPASMQLPASQSARALVVAELYLGVAQETGCVDLAFLGIQLLRANSVPVPFSLQKRLTNAFAASARVQTDWQTRATGQLVDVYPHWVDYAKKVKQDNATALRHLAEQHSAGHSATRAPPTKVDEDPTDITASAAPHEYFTSRRAEEVARASALEKNIVQALQQRATHVSGKEEEEGENLQQPNLPRARATHRTRRSAHEESAQDKTAAVAYEQGDAAQPTEPAPRQRRGRKPKREDAGMARARNAGRKQRASTAKPMETFEL